METRSGENGPTSENTVLRIYDEKQAFAGIYQWKESSGDIRPIKIFME